MRSTALLLVTAVALLVCPSLQAGDTVMQAMADELERSIKTLQEYAQLPLLGGYPVDDEGVPAARTVVAQRGLLKTLLSTRTPVRGISASSGNRRGGGAIPSNLVFSGTGGRSDPQLRQELIELVKERELEFGVIVRRVANPILTIMDDPMASMILFVGGRGGESAQSVIAAYKLYPDGHEELVRNLQVSDLDTSTFKEIVAISEQPTVTTIPFQPPSSARSMFSGPPLGGTPVISLVTPSLLFEDMTLKKPSGEIPKPPVASHPAFAK